MPQQYSSVDDLRQKQLLDWINQHTDFTTSTLTMVSGDASFRRYFRTQTDNPVIAVDAPPVHEDSQVFVNVALAYAEHQVPVPQVYAHDAEKGMYLLEDLGNVMLSDVLGADNYQSLYRQALNLLPQIQACQSTAAGRLPSFDDALLDREFHLFSHWLLDVHLDLEVDSNARSMIDQAFARLRDNFHSQPQCGVHRDYHSRNLMLDEQQRIRIIDFQDAVIGPITYDAASLLRDCYQCWPEDSVGELLKQHWQQHFSQYPWQQFKTWFDLTGIQRHVKASGIFARLCHRDGKQAYLLDIPNTLRHLTRVGLEYSEFREFATWVDAHVLPAVEAKNAC